MNKLIKYIGIFVLVIGMLSIPVLFALSMVFFWSASVQYILLILTVGDVYMLFIALSCLMTDFEDI